MFFIYVLQSQKTHRYYVGQTEDIPARLLRHNSGMMKSTKHGVPWKLLVSLPCSTRSEAMQLEKKIKSRGIKRFLSDNNLIRDVASRPWRY